MNILALDVSLTATGWAFSEPNAQRSGVLRPPNYSERGMARLHWIRNSVVLLAVHADLVVIEGYAYGAKGSAVINIGELGGVLRLALYDGAIPYVEIPPTSVKLFATGKGNVGKPDMLAAAIRKLGYSRNDHNEADALWLLEMARARYVNCATTEYQQRAIDKIQWPKVPTWQVALKETSLANWTPV